MLTSKHELGTYMFTNVNNTYLGYTCVYYVRIGMAVRYTS